MRKVLLFFSNINNQFSILFSRRISDPLFHLSTPLREHELDTKTTTDLNPLRIALQLQPSNGGENHDNKTDFVNTVKECQSEILGAGWYGKGCAKILKKPKKRRKLK